MGLGDDNAWPSAATAVARAVAKVIGLFMA
jgi:hypothetical protein